MTTRKTAVKAAKGSGKRKAASKARAESASGVEPKDEAKAVGHKVLHIPRGDGPGPWGGKKPPRASRSTRAYGGFKAVVSVALKEVTDGLPDVAPRKRMSPEACDELYRYLSLGGTTLGYAKSVGIPFSTVQEWAAKDKERYERAKEDGAEIIMDALVRIAMTPDYQTETTVITDSSGKKKTVKKTADAVFARKLAVSAGLEWLKMRFPKRYGNHSTTDVNITFANAIAAARGRIKRPEPEDVIDATPAPAPGAAAVSASAPALLPVSPVPSAVSAAALREAVKRASAAAPAPSPASSEPLPLEPSSLPLEDKDDDDDWLS